MKPDEGGVSPQKMSSNGKQYDRLKMKSQVSVNMETSDDN